MFKRLILLLAMLASASAYAAPQAIYNRQADSPTQFTDEIKHGAKNVTLAGTAEALASSTSCAWVVIQAKRTNTGRIYVGGASVPNDDTGGLYLTAGDSVTVDVLNLSQVYVNSTVTGEGVTYVYSK